MSYDVLVIGGGPAGLSAALNVRARGRSVRVVANPLEENPLWRAEKVDNHLGMPALSGAELLKEFRSHAEEAGAAFLEGKVLNTVRMDETWYVGIGSDMENAKALVLAGGVARGKKYPGEAEFLGRGVSYCATCDGMLYRGRDVVVLGWTESAEREADFLRRIGCAVRFHDRPQGVEILGEDAVTGVRVNGREEKADAVFLLRPAVAPTALLPGLAVENGAVTVDRNMATSLPGVFAAGDCTGGPYQAAKAAGEGLIAGQSAAKWTDRTNQ